MPLVIARWAEQSQTAPQKVLFLDSCEALTEDGKFSAECANARGKFRERCWLQAECRQNIRWQLLDRSSNLELSVALFGQQ